MFVGFRADNRVVRWNRKILVRETRLGVEQAHEIVVGVGVVPRVADEQVVGLHRCPSESLECEEG
ncbi:hypothetical protein D3C76_1476890 [compost metagenome]